MTTYRNNRKRFATHGLEVFSMSRCTITEEWAKILVQKVLSIYSDNILSVILYGSVARGDNGDESDIDIALIVDKDDEQQHDELLEAIVDINLDHNCLISPALIERSQFEKWSNILPYYKNIKKEGIVLWKAA